MKITVTYQKDDIVKLIKEDLQRKGLKQAEGTELKYTGIKPVVICVDAEEVIPVSEDNAPVKRSRRNQVEETAEDVGATISDLIKTSSELEKNNSRTSPKSQRSLSNNESYEYPGK